MFATCTFPKLPNLTRGHLLYGVQVFLLFPGLCWILVICLKCNFLVALLSVLRHFQIPTASFPPPPQLFSLNTVGTRHLCRVDFTESFELTGERKGREENARGNISFSKHLRTEYEYSPSWSLKSSGHDPELLSRNSLARSSSWGLSLYSISLVPVNTSPAPPPRFSFWNTDKDFKRLSSSALTEHFCSSKSVCSIRQRAPRWERVWLFYRHTN